MTRLMKRYLANFNLNIGRWFDVVGVVHMNSALMNFLNMLENDVTLTAIYGCHMGHIDELIGPHNCTEYVSITVCPPCLDALPGCCRGWEHYIMWIVLVPCYLSALPFVYHLLSHVSVIAAPHSENKSKIFLSFKFAWLKLKNSSASYIRYEFAISNVG